MIDDMEPDPITDPATSRFDATKVIHCLSARPMFSPREWRVGVMWDPRNRWLYVSPLPMVSVKMTIPRLWWKKMREHFLFVPIFAMVGIAVGILIGGLIFGRVTEPAMVFSSMPTASLKSEPYPLTSTGSSSPQVEMTPDPSPSSVAGGFATSRSSATPPAAVVRPSSTSSNHPRSTAFPDGF
jgi:hypothetical protein